jgi:hypothetical protein
MRKEGNKQTHTWKQRQKTKQGYLSQLDNNKNSTNTFMPGIML